MAIAITLARALKIKNRIRERINAINKDIQTYNVVPSGNEQEVLVHNLLKQREDLVKCLVSLKTIIMDASAPIRSKILYVSELKGVISLLKSLDTTHGRRRRELYYDSEDTVYEAQVRKSEVDEGVTSAQRQIDELQDEIEAHNHKVMIEVDLPNDLV